MMINDRWWNERGRQHRYLRLVEAETSVSNWKRNKGSGQSGWKKWNKIEKGWKDAEKDGTSNVGIDESRVHSIDAGLP